MRAIKVFFCYIRYLERNKYDCGGVDFNRYDSFNQKVKHLVGSIKVVFTKGSGIQLRKELLYEGKKSKQHGYAYSYDHNYHVVFHICLNL